MTVHFTKNDDLIILFHFNMKKLNLFNFLHIKMMKISFEIIGHYCFVREICILMYIYVIIRLNKNKGLVRKNLKIVFGYWKK